jgi:glycosyltransferase involved in cell wall biosynthesis
MIWFVVPAWKRAELSAICLAQLRGVMDTIGARGVVIADDGNLDVARDLGFDTIERDNAGLGRKFNDGMEYAGSHGAEWIVPFGSDSFVDPAYFLPLPDPSVTRTSAMYAPVTADRLVETKVGSIGAGPRMFHRSVLERVGFRPAPDALMRTIDSHTVRALGPLTWEWRDLHPLQYVGFRVAPFITSYDYLRRTWGTAERRDPWPRLAKVYPPHLVERVRRLMA